ncbi:MAG: ATP-dependent nuclease [Fusobacteriaceae bacterium]
MIIGAYLRHIKAYKGITYIPIGFKYKFITYLGENGVGKSSILESLDCFFNNKNYSINKSALNDGIYTKSNNPFISPIFIIKKEKITRSKKEFENLSNFFWDINIKDLATRTQSITKDFFCLRDELIDNNYKKETHYLLVVGEKANTKNGLHFGPFQNAIIDFFNKNTQKENLHNDEIEEISLNSYLPKNMLTELKNLYAFVYLPVELEAKSFTKIETIEMQKIFNKKIKSEIENALGNINLDRANGINTKLSEFVNQIELTLNREYTYDSDNKRNKKLTKTDLVEKILEVYFQQRSLYKKDSKGNKKIEELSAGEKRQTLINLVYAFLKTSGIREKSLIIAIDEPENSLHSSLCYDQFEKLKEISKENQILITTHWYGHLPIISEGYSHFIEHSEDKITFDSIDLYNYRKDFKDNFNFNLKSINDLVQSIFYSTLQTPPYTWIICEGISEKIYFEYFYQNEIQNKKLRILSMDGSKHVIRLFKYLQIPISLEIRERDFGKIFCLIDTDSERSDYKPNECQNLAFRRLCNKDLNITELISLNNGNTTPTDIEQSLNPIIFKETLEALDVEEKFKIKCIINHLGNTSFTKNFRNLDLEDYFKQDKGINKIIFAKKYIEILSSKSDPNGYIPKWIIKIKNFLDTGQTSSL